MFAPGGKHVCACKKLAIGFKISEFMVDMTSVPVDYEHYNDCWSLAVLPQAL